LNREKTKINLELEQFTKKEKELQFSIAECKKKYAVSLSKRGAKTTEKDELLSETIEKII